MQILFAISILCSFGLAITAIAIARHVRTLRTSTRPQRDFASYLFAAAKDQNSRIPQNLPPQTAPDILTKKSWDRPSDRVTVGRRTQAHQFPSLKRF